MFYSDNVKKACNILYEAHKDDVDKGGYPYVFHPFYLATQMEDEDSVCVALLHDVIEDHGNKYSLESLAKEGFSENVICALRLLTHDESVPYLQYVEAISKNPIASKVKIADLKHNLDDRRTGGNRPKKYDLYLQALEILETKANSSLLG